MAEPTYDVTLSWRPLAAVFDLKGSRESLADWCGAALPAFPERPNTRSGTAEAQLLWIGPEHWLLHAPLVGEDALTAALRGEDAPSGIAINMISDSLVFFGIEGRDAREVMATATPLDLDPAVFPAEGATMTEAFGQKALVLRCDAGFDLAVDRSYGPMLADYLRHITGAPLADRPEETP